MPQRPASELAIERMRQGHRDLGLGQGQPRRERFEEPYLRAPSATRTGSDLADVGGRRQLTHADAYSRSSCCACRCCRRRSNVASAANRVGDVLQFTVRLRITGSLLCTGSRRVASMPSGEARLLPYGVRARISGLIQGSGSQLGHRHAGRARGPLAPLRGAAAPRLSDLVVRRRG